MSSYKNSKSQSKSQSKNGGRRRKRTMRKLRRGRKSRKVMRGGGGMDTDQFNKWLSSLTPGVRSKLYTAFNVEEVDQPPSDLFKKMAGNSAASRFNTSAAAMSITDADIKKLLNDYQPPT